VLSLACMACLGLSRRTEAYPSELPDGFYSTDIVSSLGYVFNFEGRLIPSLNSRIPSFVEPLFPISVFLILIGSSSCNEKVSCSWCVFRPTCGHKIGF
jgi:hypothetical protein